MARGTRACRGDLRACLADPIRAAPRSTARPAAACCLTPCAQTPSRRDGHRATRTAADEADQVVGAGEGRRRRGRSYPLAGRARPGTVSSPDYGTTSHLPCYQEKQQAVTAARRGGGPLPSRGQPADRLLTKNDQPVVARSCSDVPARPGSSRYEPAPNPGQLPHISAGGIVDAQLERTNARYGVDPQVVPRP